MIDTTKANELSRLVVERIDRLVARRVHVDVGRYSLKRIGGEWDLAGPNDQRCRQMSLTDKCDLVDALPEIEAAVDAAEKLLNGRIAAATAKLAEANGPKETPQ